MKFYSNILVSICIILGFTSLCSASPLSNILLLFQKDLVIDVIYANHKNLIQGSEVYMAEDLEGPKTLIGEVKSVSLTEAQMSKVEVSINKKHKEKIYETTPFVLMSNVFSANPRAYIVAISSMEESDKSPLESGDSVKGIPFLEYRFSTAGEEFKRVLGRIKEQNSEIVSQLENYIDTLNTEEFGKKIDELINQLSQFSLEQKESFKNEVLPALRDTFNSIMKKLEDQQDMEKSKALEKQFKEIEDLVDV